MGNGTGKKNKLSIYAFTGEDVDPDFTKRYGISLEDELNVDELNEAFLQGVDKTEINEKVIKELNDLGIVFDPWINQAEATRDARNYPYIQEGKEIIESFGLNPDEVVSALSRAGYKGSGFIGAFLSYHDLDSNSRLTPRDHEVLSKLYGNIRTLQEVAIESFVSSKIKTALPFSEKMKLLYKNINNNPDTIMAFNGSIKAISILVKALNESKSGVAPLTSVNIIDNYSGGDLAFYQKSDSSINFIFQVFTRSFELLDEEYRGVGNAMGGKPYFGTASHELGHYIHDKLFNLDGTMIKSTQGISSYGNKNPVEAFAEAFKAYTLGVKNPNEGKAYYKEFQDLMKKEGLSNFEGIFKNNPPIA